MLLCSETGTLTQRIWQHNVTLSTVHRWGVSNHEPPRPNWVVDCHMVYVKDCSRYGDITPIRSICVSNEPQIVFVVQQNRLPTNDEVQRSGPTGAGLSVHAFPTFHSHRENSSQKSETKEVEEAIVVVPKWPNRIWYSLLIQMAFEIPVNQSL